MNLDFRSAVLLEAAHRFEETTRVHECAQCAYSQVFAVQPRAICVHPSAALKGTVLYAGQKACNDMVAQRGEDLRLGVWLALAEIDPDAFIHPHAA